MNKTILRAKHLALSVAIGLAMFYGLMASASSAYAQADEYFLWPANVYYYEPFVTTGSSFSVSDNDLLMTGSCTSGGGWTSCGAGVAVTRPTSDEVDAVLGFIVDWQNASVSSQTHPRPQAMADDVSGAGTFLMGSQGCAVSGGANCVTPYEKRWCITTDTRADELDHLECDETPNHWDVDAEPVTSTLDSLTFFVTNTAGGTRAILIYVSMYWLVLDCPEGHSPNEDNICEEDEPPPPPPPTPTGPVDVGATCSFNYSTTITATGGTTVTEEYSYTVAANLVQNYSFEENDGTSPANWTAVGYDPPLGVFALLFYGSGIFESRTGVRHVRPGGDDGVMLSQDMPVYANGVYQVGFHYRCSEFDGCSFYNAATLNWEGNAVATAQLGSTHSPTYYIPISDTVVSAGGGGSAWLAMELFGPIANWEDDEVLVDDMFIFPIDEDGEILCSPEYYPIPPGQPITTTAPTGCAITYAGLCFPPVMDTSCWNCQRPRSIVAIGEWLLWLFCGIRNLFFCHLYNWFLALGNWVTGLWNNLLVLLRWLPTVGQAIVNWGAQGINSTLAWLGDMWTNVVNGATAWLRTLVQNILNTQLVQAIYNFVGGVGYVWDLFSALVALFVYMLGSLFQAVVNVVELVIGFIQAVSDALTGDEVYSIAEFFPGVLPDELSRSSVMETNGPAEEKALYLFLLSLVWFDDTLGTLGLAYAQWLIFGVAGVAVILWTLYEWKQVIPN